MINSPSSPKSNPARRSSAPWLSLALLAGLSGCHAPGDQSESGNTPAAYRTADLRRESGDTVLSSLAEILSSSSTQAETEPSPALTASYPKPDAKILMNTPEARWNMNSFSQFMPTQLIQAQIAPQDLKKSPPSNPDAPKSSSEVPTDSHKSSAAPVASKTHNQQAHQADTPFRDHHEVTSMPSLKELFFGYLMLVFPTMILLMIRGERLQKRRDAEFQARKEKRLSIEQQEREKKRRAFQEEIDQYIRDNEPKDSSPDA